MLPRWLVAGNVACLSGTGLTTDALWPLIGGVVRHREYLDFLLVPYLP